MPVIRDLRLVESHPVNRHEGNAVLVFDFTKNVHYFPIEQATVHPMFGKIGKSQASYQAVENIRHNFLAPGVIALLTHPPDDVIALQPFCGKVAKEFWWIL